MPALAHRQWRTIRKGCPPPRPRSPRTRPSTTSASRPNDCVTSQRWPHQWSAHQPTGMRPRLTAKAATALQDVLGDLHDAVVTEAWLRQTASLMAPAGEAANLVATGVATGQLIAVERETQQTSRAAWLGRGASGPQGAPHLGHRRSIDRGGGAVAQMLDNIGLPPCTVGRCARKWGRHMGPSMTRRLSRYETQRGPARFGRRYRRYLSVLSACGGHSQRSPPERAFRCSTCARKTASTHQKPTRTWPFPGYGAFL